MVADHFLLLLCLWLVDGVRAGIQWFGRYQHAHENQPCLLLVDPDTLIVLFSDYTQAGIHGRILGRVFFGNIRGVVYPVALFARRVEEDEGLKLISFEKHERRDERQRQNLQHSGSWSLPRYTSRH